MITICTAVIEDWLNVVECHSSDRNKFILLKFVVISDVVNKCIIAICIAGMGNWLNVEDERSSDHNKVCIT